MAGLRGQKATVYENGIKVPFFIRWPKGFEGNRKIDWPSAHIDIVPTLLDACRIQRPSGIDGVSLMPLLDGTAKKLAERDLYFQWHRGDVPELYRAFAVRGSQYKLVQAEGWGQVPEGEYKFELFDIINDPSEKYDIAAAHPEIVKEMKNRYEKWFEDVSSTRGFEPPCIIIGTKFENPTTLTRQDWRGAKDWNDTDVGYWKTQAAVAGTYTLWLQFSDPVKFDSTVRLQFNDTILTSSIEKGQDRAAFENIHIKKGYVQIKGWVETGGNIFGVRYLDVVKR